MKTQLTPAEQQALDRLQARIVEMEKRPCETQTITAIKYSYVESIEQALRESMTGGGFQTEAVARRLAKEVGEIPVKITVTVETLSGEGEGGE